MSVITQRRYRAKIRGRTFDFSKNNFDLVHLIAVIEVAIGHSVAQRTPDQFSG